MKLLLRGLGHLPELLIDDSDNPVVVTHAGYFEGSYEQHDVAIDRDEYQRALAELQVTGSTMATARNGGKLRLSQNPKGNLDIVLDVSDRGFPVVLPDVAFSLQS